MTELYKKLLPFLKADNARAYRDVLKPEPKPKNYQKVNKVEADKIKHRLEDLLNECLESCNQERSFTVTNVDLDAGVFSVDFQIVTVEEDDYIGFAGY